MQLHANYYDKCKIKNDQDTLVFIVQSEAPKGSLQKSWLNSIPWTSTCWKQAKEGCRGRDALVCRMFIPSASKYSYQVCFVKWMHWIAKWLSNKEWQFFFWSKDILTLFILDNWLIEAKKVFFNVVDFWWFYSTIFLLLHVTCY